MGRRVPETVQQMAIGQFAGVLLELGVGRGEQLAGTRITIGHEDGVTGKIHLVDLLTPGHLFEQTGDKGRDQGGCFRQIALVEERRRHPHRCPACLLSTRRF